MSDKAVDETITPKTPIWIGVEIPTSWGYYRICIGVNQEDGHEISYCNETDIQFGKEQGYDCWNYDGKIVVKYGTDSRVFNDNHELINNKPLSEMTIQEINKMSLEELKQLHHEEMTTLVDKELTWQQLEYLEKLIEKRIKEDKEIQVIKDTLEDLTKNK